MTAGLTTTDFYGDRITATRQAAAVWHGRIMIDNLEQYPPIHKNIPTESANISYEMQFTRDKDLIAEYKQLRKRLVRN